MELICKEKCTGCMSCVESCPKKSINIEKDDLGHLYPVIDEKTCVNCGKCLEVCPERSFCTFNKIKKTYAVWSLDSQDRKSSASGGAASVFYQVALQHGFMICGVEYQEDFHVVHVLTNDAKRIDSFKQSKYVYSEIGDAYKEIKIQLQQGIKVLFISLPCKVAGLIKFLGKKYTNLITVDIVCHGTPSHHMLSEHLNKIDINKLAKQLCFRDNNEFILSLKSASGKKIYSKTGKTDMYLAAFLEGLDYRLSCYQCSYARPERISDITICDFWGLGIEKPFDHPYTGAVSAVLINTEKGEEFFEMCHNQLFFELRTNEEAINGNAQLNAPTKKNAKYDEFQLLFRREGFDRAVKQCLKNEIKEFIKQNRKRQFRLKLRRIASIFIKRYRGD